MLKLRNRLRTPTLLQMDHAECGAACLGILLHYYRRFVPLSALRENCGVNRDGTNAQNLLLAARQHGLKARGLSVPKEAVRNLIFPVILHWNADHFIVCEGVDSSHAYINDPSIGHRRLPLNEFCDAFTGVAIECVPTSGFQTLGTPPRPMRSLLQRCKPFAFMLLLAAFANTLRIFSTIALAACGKVFVDNVVMGKDASTLASTVIAVFSFIALLDTAIKAASLFLIRRLKLSLTTQASMDYMQHLLRLPISFYEQRDPAEIVARDGLNEKVSQAIVESAVGFVRSSVGIICFGFVLYMISWKVFSVAISTSIAITMILRFVTARQIEPSLLLAQEMAKSHGVLLNAIAAIESIKAHANESSVYRQWTSLFSRAVYLSQQLSVLTTRYAVASALMSRLAFIAVVIVGAQEVLSQQMSIGDLLAATLILDQFLGPFDEFISLVSQAHVLQGDLNRLEDVMNNRVDDRFADTQATKNDHGPVPINKIKLAGSLELRSISFGYGPTSSSIVSQVDIKVDPGEQVGIVGVTGSGKSTLLKIAAGILKAREGEVLYDGKLHSSWHPKLLAVSVVLVEQRASLFEGTFRDNLTLWDRSINDDRILQACQDACFLEVLEGRGEGLSGHVTEFGRNLSGGERQRLAIARALVQEPSILLLDEATSNLDTVTARKVVKNIEMRGCTCLIAAHRVGAVENCCRIVVMNDGLIVQSGTHQSMLNQDGAYRRLLAEDGATRK